MSICRNFMHGSCNRGADCKFLHDPDMCFYWWKYGSCNHGDKCRKKHTTTSQKQRNTESWEPRMEPTDMRIVVDMGTWVDKCSTPLTSRDVLIVPNLFADYAPGELYNKLVDETMSCGVHPSELFKLWHGNDTIEGTHFIADDKTPWKDLCPTFATVVDRISNFFDMKVEATRFNWYKDTSQWKPFHHDASGIKPEKAAIQNFTVALSLGATRDAAFEHAKTRTTLSFPQTDGSIYCFANDTNIIWRHGILKEATVRDVGRISIICWGWSDALARKS